MNDETGNDRRLSVPRSKFTVAHSLRPCWTVFLSILRGDLSLFGWRGPLGNAVGGFGGVELGTENFWLGPDSCGELREQFSREVVGIGRVDGVLAAKIVVEDSAIGGFMDMREGEIHMIQFHRAGYAADEDDGAVLVLPLNDSDVRQRVVHLAVSVEVPGIVEKYEVAWMDYGA